MDLRATDLLRRLASGIRPDGVSASRGREPVESASFASLLSDVRIGRVASGRTVEVSKGVELSPEQRERLSVALDAAEASGATRVLALIDGEALTVDVVSRRVESGEDAAGVGVVTGVDGFVFVPEMEEIELGVVFGGGRDGATASIEAASSWRIGNRSVAELLAGRSGRGGGGASA